MIRSFVLMVIAVTVIGIGGFLVRKVAQMPQATPASNASRSAPQKFDTTGGQAMRPRWSTGARQGEGGADGASRN